MLSDNLKIQQIHESPFKGEWDELPTKEAKRYVLDNFDEGDSRRWLEGLLEEARELNQPV